jgi:hypothetical protein
VERLIFILFFLFLCFLFYSIGSVFRRFFRGLGVDQSSIVASAFGLSVTSIGVTIGYKLGLSSQQIFWVLVGLGGYAIIADLVSRRGKQVDAIRTSSIYVLIGGVVAIFLLAPALCGGTGFALFQGNYIDAFRYLEASISYWKLPYHEIAEGTSQQLLNDGLFPFAQAMLKLRPTITILYAVLVNFAPRQFLGLNYILMVYFQFLSVGILWLIAKRLIPSRPIVMLVLAALIAGGFWGQYIVDINAWSQNAALPLLLLVFLLLVCLFSSESRPDKPLFWPPIVLAVTLVGAFYVYPEATLFYLPGIVVAGLVGHRKIKRPFRFDSIVFAVAFGLLLLLAVKENNIDFVAVQKNAALSDVDWWKYFDACFFGRSGFSLMPGFGVVDAGTTLLGGYMMTPDAAVPMALALLWRGVLAAILVLVVASVIQQFRFLASPDRLMLVCALAVFVLQTVLLLLLHKYWSAGKALSYYAFLLVLVVFCPYLAGELRGGLVRNLSGVACGVLLAAQGCTLIYRPKAVYKHPTVHYRAPYPAAMSPYMKVWFNFSDWTVLKQLGPQDKIRIDVEEPWIQYFAKMLLLSNEQRFCVSHPVTETKESAVDSASTANCADATCRMYLVEVRDPRLTGHLRLESLGKH